MARVCGKCYAVHPDGVLGCEDAKRIMDEATGEFNRRVRHHREHCRGCPDPAAHIRELDRLDNPAREPIKYKRDNR